MNLPGEIGNDNMTVIPAVPVSVGVSVLHFADWITVSFTHLLNQNLSFFSCIKLLMTGQIWRVFDVPII